MKTMERYMVIIILLAGMTLSAYDKFSEEEIQNFLNEIFNLHNEYRQYHRAGSLNRTPDMDLLAAQVLDNMFLGQYNDVNENYGKNIRERKYDRRTILDIHEAKRVFLDWYRMVDSYDYFSEPSDYESYKQFTQIVWQDTKTIGIAMKCRNNKYVVQVVYFPRGNIPNQFEMNVLQRSIINDSNSSFFNRLIYENEEEFFENYIFRLHNDARIENDLPELIRDIKLDKFSYHILKIISKRRYHYHGMYGRNYLARRYNENTILDKAEAQAIFLVWYNKEIIDETVELNQILWKDTKTMGISMLRENGFYRVLAFYNPRRNAEDEENEFSLYYDILN